MPNCQLYVWLLKMKKVILSNQPSFFLIFFHFFWISERVRWHVVVFLLRLALPFLSRPLAFRNLQFRQEMNKQQTRKERKVRELQMKRCWDMEERQTRRLRVWRTATEILNHVKTGTVPPANRPHLKPPAATLGADANDIRRASCPARIGAKQHQDRETKVYITGWERQGLWATAAPASPQQ